KRLVCVTGNKTDRMRLASRRTVARRFEALAHDRWPVLNMLQGYAIPLEPMLRRNSRDKTAGHTSSNLLLVLPVLSCGKKESKRARRGVVYAMESVPGPERELERALVRCAWAGSPRAIPYHDEEWGVPVFDDQMLFEFLSLEGAQAGLSWETILKKREHYRRVFDHFDLHAIASYGPQKVEQLMADPGIVRNRAKIQSIMRNAQAVLALQQEYGSFAQFIWQFVGHRPRINQWHTLSELPATTAESDAMSKALKQRGFGFVGSTICYAFMQATGMVNDHTVDCFRYEPLTLLAASLERASHPDSI
ncbi:MAG TPA: DNA-3-methyladenine glycosylase I, partial [Ktedonobacterales bacterium]